MKNQVPSRFIKICWILTIAMLLVGATAFVDPTRPANYVPSGNSGTNPQILMATYVSATEQSALINGALLHVGDKYGQFTITSITPYSVKLKGMDGTIQILFLATDVKQLHGLTGHEVSK